MNACLSLTAGGLCQLVFRDSPATSTVLVGYPTTLRCSARDPTPPNDILWFKDGVAVTPDPTFAITYDSSAGNSQLRISSVRYPDAGGYQCIAVGSSNQILAASSVGTLTVHGKQHEYTSQTLSPKRLRPARANKPCQSKSE